jgi:hypothetical protein
VPEETWIRADFNGLLARDLLCIAHGDTVKDRRGKTISLRAGLLLTAYDDDINTAGEPDALVATGVVEQSPEQKQRHGSVWSLRIDSNGIRHESELGASA